MVSQRRLPVLACLVCTAGLFMGLAFASAEGESKGEKVHFTTVDGVTIEGLFFASAKNNAPTVMMLHALGEDPRKKNWLNLADTLNKEGNAVLLFDFRGHGDSKEIDPALFFKYPRNAASIKGANLKKTSLEFSDMSNQYYPVLVNDITAAKAFLDNRNDTKMCNTANLVVLGTETGATLGALWLNEESHRYVYTPPVLGVSLQQVAKTPEGTNTLAAVWLSGASKLGSRIVSLPALLSKAGKELAIPMVFMYNESDTSTKSIASACAKSIKGTSKKDEKYRYTVAYPIKGGGKLNGTGLLQKTLVTEEAITGYIKDVAEAKSKEWEERDFRKTQFVWRIGAGALIPAKLPNEKTLVFDTFERFLPR